MHVGFLTLLSDTDNFVVIANLLFKEEKHYYLMLIQLLLSPISYLLYQIFQLI